MIGKVWGDKFYQSQGWSGGARAVVEGAGWLKKVSNFYDTKIVENLEFSLELQKSELLCDFFALVFEL